MFSDTLVVTIDGVANTLVRVNQDAYSSEYRLKGVGGEFTMRIRNTSYKDKVRGVTVDRHNFELIKLIYPVAPAVTPEIRKVYAVFENDASANLTNSAKHTVGSLAFLTEANVTKMLNWES
nr:MAG: hypothetical protein 2 [Leviviridae sp.]